MKLIYTGRTPTDAHLLATILEEHGIARELRGEPLWIGHEPRLSKKIPVTTVWVGEEDAAAAEEVVVQHRATQNDDSLHWTCGVCGEPSPNLFDECWRCGHPRTAPSSEQPPPTVLDGAPIVGESAVPRTAEPAERVAPGALAEPEPTSEGSVDREEVPWSIPWGTLLVTAICTLICYGLSNETAPTSDAAMNKWGWRSASDIWNGDYVTLLTAAFVHADWDHFWGNMATLWLFGMRVEQAIGSFRWLLFLAASAVVSMLFDVAWLGEHSYGASGITNAAFGLFLVAAVEKRLFPWWLSLLLCAEFFWHSTLMDLADTAQEAVGAEIPEPIANVCHLTGVLFGFLVGMAFLQPWRRPVWRTLLALMVLAGGVPLFWAPWSVEWLLARGDAAWERGDQTLAIDFWQRAERRAPQDPRPFWKRAVSELARNEFAAAMEWADAAVRREEEILSKPRPTIDDLLAEAAGDVDSNSGSQQTDDSSFDWTRHDVRTTSFAVTGNSFLVRGRIHVVNGDHEKAIQDFTKALLVAVDDPTVLLARAAARWQAGHLDEADADFTMAVAFAPQDPEILLARGRFLLECGEPRSGRNDVELAAELLHRSLGPRDAVWHGQQALAHVALREPETALESLQEALASSADDWQLLALRSLVHADLERFPDGLNDAQAVLRINPRNEAGWIAKGRNLAGLERATEAEAALGRAVQINPRSADAFRERGAVRRQQREFERSLEDLNRAIELNPRNGESYLERSLTYAAMNRKRLAEADARTAAALDPTLSTLPDAEEP